MKNEGGAAIDGLRLQTVDFLLTALFAYNFDCIVYTQQLRATTS